MERNGYVADEKRLKRKKVKNNDRQEEEDVALGVEAKKAKQKVCHFQVCTRFLDNSDD